MRNMGSSPLGYMWTSAERILMALFCLVNEGPPEQAHLWLTGVVLVMAA